MCETKRRKRSSERYSGRNNSLTARHLSGSCLMITNKNLSNTQCRKILENPHLYRQHILRKCTACSHRALHTNIYDRNEIHELEVAYWERDDNAVRPTSFGESGLTDYIKNCRSLGKLWVYRDYFGASSPNERTDGSASSSAAAMEDVVHFAHALGSSNIRELLIGNLSATGACLFFDNLPPTSIHTLRISTLDMSDEEEAAVLGCVVRFLSDPIRSRSVKCLHTPLKSYQAQFVVLHQLLGSYDAVSSDSPEFMLAQKPNLSVHDVGDVDSRGSNDSIEYPAWMHHSQYSHLVEIKQRIEGRNHTLCLGTVQEAATLLRAARIVGCRVQILGDAPGIFPFFRLPNECRILILSMLAPHLDCTQIINVLSWACCAATIGYCCRQSVDDRSPMPATLDVPPWNWDKCDTCSGYDILYPINLVWTYDDLYRSRRYQSIPFAERTGTNIASADGWYSCGWRMAASQPI